MLQADELHGMQSFVPTVFTSNGLINEDRNRENFRWLMDAGIHGIQILWWRCRALHAGDVRTPAALMDSVPSRTPWFRRCRR